MSRKDPSKPPRMSAVIFAALVDGREYRVADLYDWWADFVDPAKAGKAYNWGEKNRRVNNGAPIEHKVKIGTKAIIYASLKPLVNSGYIKLAIPDRFGATWLEGTVQLTGKGRQRLGQSTRTDNIATPVWDLLRRFWREGRAVMTVDWLPPSPKSAEVAVEVNGEVIERPATQEASIS